MNDIMLTLNLTQAKPHCPVDPATRSDTRGFIPVRTLLRTRGTEQRRGFSFYLDFKNTLKSVFYTHK
jgi:hypothetical protein